MLLRGMLHTAIMQPLCSTCSRGYKNNYMEATYQGGGGGGVTPIELALPGQDAGHQVKRSS